MTLLNDQTQSVNLTHQLTWQSEPFNCLKIHVPHAEVHQRPLSSPYLHHILEALSWDHHWSLGWSETEFLTLLRTERPKLWAILAFLRAIGLKEYHSSLYIHCLTTIFKGDILSTAIHDHHWSLGWSETEFLTLLRSERPKLYTILVFLCAIGLKLYHSSLYIHCLATIFKGDSLSTAVHTFWFPCGRIPFSKRGGPTHNG